MNLWKIILATFLIFGTGMVTGGLLTHRVERSGDLTSPNAAARPQTNFPGLTRIDLLRVMQVQLDLKPEQRQVLDQILKDGQERVKKISEPIQPALREEAQHTLEEFRAALTPAQQTQMDELMKRPLHPPRRTGPPSRGDRPGERENWPRTNMTWPTNGMPRFGPGMMWPTNGMIRFGQWTNMARPTNGVPPRFGRP